MHSTQSAPGDWQGRAPSTSSRGPQGTPLGRIVAGVFLGLLAWSIVMGVVGFILLSVAASKVEDAFDESSFTDTSTSTNDTGLSDECKAKIDAGHSAGESVECSGDDTALILEYQATK
jgi:hypothetical protein